jgi:alkylation response protein AidB-like acyl-CoA dehydrogenase
VDFSPNPDQQAIIDAVDTIFAKQAGSDRARELGFAGHDDALLEALDDAGFLDVWNDDTIGPLGAVLVAEEASRHNARANVAVRVLAATAVLGTNAPRRVAVTHRNNRGPVRFGQHADTLLVVDGGEALVADVTGASPVDSPYGFPYALVETAKERSLGPGSGDVLTNWWRVAIAAELAGALDGAIAHTVEYLTHRTQFKRPLGSLQALQHRLADAYVWVEGAKWLARRAAFNRAAPEEAAAAAAYASQAAQLIGADTHQLSGAIGFTTEFNLHLWTTRLHGLRVELGGTTAHQLATAAACWG